MVCSVALQGVKEAMGQVRDKSDYNYPQLAWFDGDQLETNNSEEACRDGGAR